MVSGWGRSCQQPGQDASALNGGQGPVATLDRADSYNTTTLPDTIIWVRPYQFGYGIS